jgi:N-sulfoglucosamine sulfohydrolase
MTVIISMLKPLHLFAIALASMLSVLSISSADDNSKPVDAPKSPNILFAIADDWSYGHASAYGAKWVQTPSFNRVAKNGLLFTHAYTPNAKCAPSRACILTGRNSWQLKEAANHLCYFPQEFKGWPEALRDAGWHVGHTTKGWGPGVAKDALGNLRQMTGQPFNDHELQPTTSGIGTSDYAANFDAFLEAAPQDTPWCFWYGAIEPHRGYEFGSGVKKGGKHLNDIERVPGYWPDNEIIRNDMLDYAYEVEHFDTHLGRMLDSLEKRGLLANTLVVVTSDHGMPFPRCKGGVYEASNHVPLAIMWTKGVAQPGRTIDDYVSFIDLAPTFIQVAGLDWDATKLAESPGKSLTDIFASERSGRVNPNRDHVLIGMERHDIGRPHDVGYPVRGMLFDDQLYLHNFEIDRWPACNPETGYLNCDASPTKTFILNERRQVGSSRYWDLCFGKRPADEWYNIRKDPDCIDNLAVHPTAANEVEKMQAKLFERLRQQSDPRMFNDGHLFDEYKHSSVDQRDFYERYMSGEKLKAGWVSESDFEPEPIE